MKNLLFALIVVLATNGVSFALTLGYVDNGSPSDGLRSFTVTATGVGITGLSQFTVTGDVYQVWEEEEDPSDPFSDPELKQSVWLGDGSADGNPKDSYVIFGDLRLPVLMEDVITAETNDLSGGTAEGLGTLNNYNYNGPNCGNTWSSGDFNGDGAVDLRDATIMASNYGVPYSPSLNGCIPGDANLDEVVDDTDAWIVSSNWITSDVYLRTGTSSSVEETVELMQLVIPEGGSAIVELELCTLTNNTVVDGFSLDGTVSVLDFSGSKSLVVTVPEPGCIVLLIVGGLWFVGRRRKRS